MRFQKSFLALAVAFATIVLLFPGLSTDVSSEGGVTYGGITITFDETQLNDTVESGTSIILKFNVYNGNDTPRTMNVSIEDAEYTTSSINEKSFTVEGKALHTTAITVYADRYSKTGEYHSTVTFNSLGIDNPPVNAETWSFPIPVSVHSTYGSESMYNTLLGLMANPLPEPFDTAVWAALLSFVVWIIISAVAMFVLLHILFGQILFRKNKDLAEGLRKDIRKPLIFAMALYGLSLCMSVIGADPYYTNLVYRVSEVIYLIIGALVCWRLYKVLVMIALKAKKKVDIEEFSGLDETLVPLFHLLGKMLIGTTATAAILAVLGFNLMAILTGAGIIGIALSLGAQGTLNQFFSGLNLLISRPFNPGDKVRLGTDPTVLTVRRVGVMNTLFESWHNAEVFLMPNSRVVDSTIVNITAENVIYKVVLFFEVPYESDLELAKKLLFEAAMEHPRVVKDGSLEMPLTRVMSLDEGFINVRLTAYVDDFEDYGSIGGEIRESVLGKFIKEGINMPYKKMDVRVFQESAWTPHENGERPENDDEDSENNY